MFASTRPRDAAAPSRAGFAGVPLLAVCCLLFILFAIASTIVLALIPIYLPRKDAGALSRRDTLFFVLASRANLGFNGALDARSARSLADAVARAQGLPPGSIDLTRVRVVSPTTGGRRRRRNNLKRRVRQNNDRGRGSRMFCEGRRNRNRCGECAVVSIRVEIEISFEFFGTQITISITIEVLVDLGTLLQLLGSATTPQVTDTTTSASTTSTTQAVTASLAG